MKYPQAYAIGRITRDARLRTTCDGKHFVEATIEMDEPETFKRGEHKQLVDVSADREDQIALVCCLKRGVKIRIDGNADWTCHKDPMKEIFYGRVRITGAVEILEEVNRERA